MADGDATFANRLKSAIFRAGITQHTLASKVGATQPAVSSWVLGKKEPTPENLTDIARHLGVRREWLEKGLPPMKVSDPEGDRADYLANAAWAFREAPKDGGRDFGNANVWSFDPSLGVLVREVLQNAKDAALSPDKKVEVTFRIVSLEGMEFEDYRTALRWEKLRPHLDASREGKQKFNTLLRDGLDRIDSTDKLQLLIIEDTGTTGLTGPERGDGSGPFMALCRNNLDSSKKEAGAGGAFGLGKAVLWRASRLSTVLFCSHLVQPEDGRTMHRVFGRCELAWHRSHLDYAGPGWFGRIGDDGEAESYWDNPTLAADLYLGREGTGTTMCVVGFHDASADKEVKPVELAQDLVRAAAENFFPALVAEKLAVRVEVYDSGEQYRAGRPTFSQAVNPETYMPSSVRMLRAYRNGTLAEQLGENPTDVAAREVTLAVPKLNADKKSAEQEHKAVLLVTGADEDADAGSERPYQLALFRGPGMVVQTLSLAGVCLGARPFHALLVCGRGPEFVAPTESRSNPQADAAAEAFLRTAEPPSHDKWTATPDLKAVYAWGCKARLEKFLKDAKDVVAKLVKPVPKDTGDGPNSLKELFRIGSEPGPKPEQPRVIWQEGRVVGEGEIARWHVSARVRLKAKKIWQRLTPAVYFLAETGTGTPVGWTSLKAEKGCEVKGQALLVPPDTRELRFSGVALSGPIPAAESCVVVDIKKFSETKEVTP